VTDPTSGPAGSFDAAGRLVGDPVARIDHAAARALLPTFFDPIEAVEFLPSTMTRAGELAAAGAPEGAIVLADHQTAGRGRLGRTWVDRPGASLMLSVVLRPSLPADRLWSITAATGVALAEAAAELLGPAAAVSLKWPNDLLIGGRKAAGLLAEGHLGGALVLGMGVNVDQTADDFPPELRDRVTSLAMAAGGGPRGRPARAALLAGWATRFVDRYRSLPPDGASIMPSYRRRLGTLGSRVRVTMVGAAPVVGTAVDVRADGGLIIRDDRGGTSPVLAGDVEHLRPDA
jgi:BirA family biotin operon repressor/biotin-[acetyl-CoA-carboxylase] ligase